MKFYKLTPLITITTLALLFIFCNQSDKGIIWINDFDRGKETSKEEEKPLIVYYRVIMNEFCKDMERKTFYSDDVLNMRDEFVWVWIDGDVDIELPPSYGVIAYPTIIAYNHSGKELIRRVGFIDGEALKTVLQDTLAGICEYDEIVEKVEDEPDNPEYLWELALAQKYRGMTFDLLDTLSVIIELEDDNEKGYKTKAMLEHGFQYMVAGNYEKAIEKYNEIIMNYPETEEAPMALDYTGDCYRLLGDDDRAIDVYTEVVENYPDTTSAKQSENKLGKIKAFEKTIKALWE